MMMLDSESLAQCGAFKPVLFERNEEVSYIASDLFCRKYDLREVFEGHEIRSNYGHFANMIDQRFDSNKHPKPLEQIAMKSAMQNRIPLNNLPQGLQMNAKHGYLTKTKPYTSEYLAKCGAFKPVFFERNEEISYIASDLFYRQYDLREVFEGDEITSNFGNFSNMIAQRFNSKKHPKPLEQIAMKSAMQNRIPLNNLPQGLQMNAKHGYLTTNI